MTFMKWKKILTYSGIIILAAMLVLIIYMYPFYHFFFSANSIQLNNRLTILSGAGNSGILETDSAIVVIDTKMGTMAKDLYELANEKAGKRKILVINTHFHGDHLNGNHVFKGCPIYIGRYTKEFATKNIDKKNMPGIFISDSLVIPLGDETLVLCNLGQAHTFDDMVVYLKNRKILFTGDLSFNKINPVLMREDGADIEKWKSVLRQIPLRWQIKQIVPGHGDPGGVELLNELTEYFENMQSAVGNPEKESAVIAKYAGWMKMPLMASPERTLDFLRKK